MELRPHIVVRFCLQIERHFSWTEYESRYAMLRTRFRYVQEYVYRDEYHDDIST